MAHVVKLYKKQSKEKLKEMFSWCTINCSKEYGKNGTWGTSWWTEHNNTEFHFMDYEDAIMFKLLWYY